MLKKIFNWFLSKQGPYEKEYEEVKGTAVITTVKTGNNKGKFKYLLKAPNGYVIATSGGNFEDKHEVMQMVWTWFKGFEIIDETVA